MPERDTIRINTLKFALDANTSLVYSDINTSPIIGPPLSKEKLKQLLNLIISQVAQLPETNEESSYDI